LIVIGSQACFLSLDFSKPAPFKRRRQEADKSGTHGRLSEM
jgi:hypothetical protein